MSIRTSASAQSRQCVGFPLALAILAAACAGPGGQMQEGEPVSPYAEEEFDELRISSDTLMTTDCNGNGLVDRLEVRPYGFGFAETHGPFSTEESPVQALAADLDGDRRPELIALNKGESDYFDGSLTFISGLFTVRDFFHDIAPIELADSQRPRCFATGDFNGDRAIDIAVLYDSGLYGDPHLTTLYNAGDGSFPPDAIVVQPVSGTSARCLATADLDRDGDRDLLVTVVDFDTYTDGTRPILLARRNDGAAGFSDLWFTLGLGGVENIFVAGPGSILAADVDDDGDLDVVLTTERSPGKIAVHFNTGDFSTYEGPA